MITSRLHILLPFQIPFVICSSANYSVKCNWQQQKANPLDWDLNLRVRVFVKHSIHYLHNPIIHLYYPPKLLQNHQVIWWRNLEDWGENLTPYPTTARGLECYFRIQHGRGEVRSRRFPLECSFSNRKYGRNVMICWILAMKILQEIWKQNLRPGAVVGYGVKIFLPSPPNYVTRSPGIVCNFSWDMKMSQEKSKTMPMQIFFFFFLGGG